MEIVPRAAGKSRVSAIAEPPRISSILPAMAQIIFRHLSPVAAVERQLKLHASDQLLDDDIQELPHLVDDASRELFGITQRDTFYWALPPAVRRRFGCDRWEENFELLGSRSRDSNAHWNAFDLDLCCKDGSSLHCLEVFGRQLICALQELHPDAVLAFSHRKAANRP